MRFVELAAVLPGMRMWGAQRSNRTFMISLDRSGPPYRCSVKPVGAKPYDGTMTDLGKADTFEQAKELCTAYLKSLS